MRVIGWHSVRGPSGWMLGPGRASLSLGEYEFGVEDAMCIVCIVQKRQCVAAAPWDGCTFPIEFRRPRAAVSEEFASRLKRALHCTRYKKAATSVERLLTAFESVTSKRGTYLELAYIQVLQEARRSLACSPRTRWDNALRNCAARSALSQSWLQQRPCHLPIFHDLSPVQEPTRATSPRRRQRRPHLE